MSSRKAGPVLFELVRDAAPRPSASGHAPAPAEPPPGGGMFNWAGRTIRVPAGYLFVVAAVIVTAALVGYVIGFGRAERIAKAEAAQRAQLGAGVTDPLDEGPITLNLTTPRPEEPAVGSGLPLRNAETTQAPAASEGPARTSPGAPASGDPREAGLNYYVLVRDMPAEGDRLVEWLASRGVASMTEPVGGGLVKVIVVNGFERGQASSARALSFKQHLRELGARWKRDHSGSSDFSDLYLEKYAG